MKTWLRCQRGTASIEAVVLLPVFVLLFAASLHFTQLGKAALSTAQAARACAWAHALAGCTEQRPAACAEASHQREETKPEAQSQLRDASPEGDYEDFTDRLGFLGGVLEGFLGEAFETARSAEVRKLMASNERASVSSSIVLLCNPRPPSFESFIKKIFSQRDRLKGSGG